MATSSGSQITIRCIVFSRMESLGVAELLDLRSGEFVVEVGPSEVGNHVVASSFCNVLNEAILFERLQTTRNSSPPRWIIHLTLEIEEDSLLVKSQTRLCQQLKNGFRCLIHPLEPPAHTGPALFSHKSTPTSLRAVILSRPIVTSLCQILSTIDSNGGLPADSGGLGVAENGAGRVLARSTPRVGTAVKANVPRGLEPPATIVEGSDLTHADALTLSTNQRAGVRVTASNSQQRTPGEGHLHTDRDQ